MANDTIFALSSAPGRAGIAVVRISGPQAGATIEGLTGRALPEPRRASLRTLSAPSGDRIDEALVLWFPGPESATGEDVAEFHVHGGRAILEAVFAALNGLPGLRPAGRGEFTRRAVENGRLDLTRAEGLADLIDAETEAQRRQALAQYDGAFFRACEDWRARLIRLTAWAEAGIDFSDEELDGDLGARVDQGVSAILAEIGAQLAAGRQGEIVREGSSLAVVGPPNAGKSSLLNALAGRDIAIVADTPGTTRDVLEVRLDLGGYLVVAADTAGLRDTGETVEAEGVRRALARAGSADLVLLLLDGTASDPFASLPQSLATDPDVLRVWNKHDLPWPQPREGLAISVRTGEGLDRLLELLVQRVQDGVGRVTGESAMVTRARHRHALEQVTAALSRAVEGRHHSAELVAEDLRLALRALGRITGRVDVEELLDVIFRDFCIGK
jgi:tRNA modification GTPase